MDGFMALTMIENNAMGLLGFKNDGVRRLRAFPMEVSLGVKCNKLTVECIVIGKAEHVRTIGCAEGLSSRCYSCSKRPKQA